MNPLLNSITPSSVVDLPYINELLNECQRSWLFELKLLKKHTLMDIPQFQKLTSDLNAIKGHTVNLTAGMTCLTLKKIMKEKPSFNLDGSVTFGEIQRNLNTTEYLLYIIKK
jgi:hypothetical protein